MTQLGKLSPRFRFVLNPYSDVRFTACPICQAKTRLRKLPLVIHVDPLYSIALNKTCRYCPTCDLLIAHRDEVEALLVAIFEEREPEMIGNDYLVIGTLERPEWKRGVKEPLAIGEMVGSLHDFKEVLELKPFWSRSKEPRRGKSPARKKPGKGARR